MSDSGFSGDIDLARVLTQLGDDLRTDATEQAIARIHVAATQTSRPQRRPRGALIAVATAIAALVAASISPVRSAVADLLGIDGIRVRDLPSLEAPPPVGAKFHLGERVEFDEARRRADFEPLLPRIDAFGQTPEIYVRDVGGGIVSFVYPLPDGRREPLILTEFKADPVEAFEKVLAGGTRVEQLTIHGEQAMWIDGEEHVLFFVDPTDGFIEVPGHLSRNTLIWTRADVTLRLEGDLTREEAHAVADSIGP